MPRIRAILVCAAAVLATPVSAQQLDLQSQVSTWLVAGPGEPASTVAGIRYLPALTFDTPAGGERRIDLELSPNLFATGTLQGPGPNLARARPYRAWARFKTPRYEGRVGLQKINFGSATLLRPLMWFDSVDPRDPLQITDGVYAGLFRYYLPNRATVWTWGLYGNTSLRGWDAYATRARRPEVGGRIEIPAPRGQVAITTHHRSVDIAHLAPGATGDARGTPEHRYALDGKWDVGIGLWAEGTWTRLADSPAGARDQMTFNVGADYTFDVGSGLYVLGEFAQLGRPAVAEPGPAFRLVAFLARYPLGLLDSLSAIVYVDATRHSAYRFVSWQRTYDRWQFHAMGFWNPADAALQPGSGDRPIGRSPLGGRGLQVMAVFNHRWRRQWS